MTIFISVASYRDPQLLPTIRDCLAKATYPRDLVFGICDQHGPGEQHVFDGIAARVVAVPCQESQGCCWARARIMQLYDREDWFFQIDSHMRFVQDWDSKLLFWVENSDARKPLLTTYGTVFTVGPPETHENVPYRMNFDRFAAGIPLFKPGQLDGWRGMSRLYRARFLSAHFLFAPGSFVGEVPYDPDLYFHGEEMSLAVRAFTWDYDMFHPPEIIVWHEYTRAYRRKHWDDHTGGNGTIAWSQRNQIAEERVRQLLRQPTIGRLGMGRLRSMAQYEAWAGINLTTQQVSEAVTQFTEPPLFR